MRLRSLAGATLFVLQAFVAARPFVALPVNADRTGSSAAHCHDMGANAEPATDDAVAYASDRHIADATHGMHDAPQRTSSTESHEDSHQPGRSDSHDAHDAGCHAGAPCCAPALPVAVVRVPQASVAPSTRMYRAPRDVSHVAESVRRQPPATAPPTIG